MSNQLALPGLLGEADEWIWRDDFDEVTDVKRFEHATVMRGEVVRAIAPHPGGVYVDATLGGGGHVVALLEAEPKARIVAFDRDPVAIEAARERLATVADRVTLVHATFSSLREQLDRLGIDRVDGLMADLGVSSPQLDDPERGMSFRREGPIDMRMDREAGETALELLERLTDDELANVIYEYGDERRSRRIARSIKKALVAGELQTTLDLRRAIVRAVGPARVGGIDPATRSFQALRIAVNRELEELTDLLAALPGVVAPGGVAAVLSFQSLEDRLVKRTFVVPPWTPLTKKPQTPTDEECSVNARARSAKLRAARREADAGEIE
ncbi:MAG TPA: 16S rRNA (cytosine(1402)-N(4))-methyltransferase RsmH [Gaiellaceae bacterium]|jgi:16S rRNA (cytosine1402-N4)-methyltransferase|nr:16S rRNA (cytosine(1402)-N(4))-methyltransferase RsmH [Gaiellaceae bacterium]